MNVKRREIVALVVSLAAAATLWACESAGGNSSDGADALSVRNEDGFSDINVAMLERMLETPDEITLINTRSPVGEIIPDTDLLIAYNELSARRDELPAKDEPVVLYCRSGRQSTAAAKILVGLGYTNVMELDGGYTAWRQQGNETEKVD